MIDMFTVRTSEIDEFDEAIQELKSPIDFSALKKNLGGLIFCHIDFIESGMVAALCKNLPFNVIGMTSMTEADAHGINQGNYKDEIEQRYHSARNQAALSLGNAAKPFMMGHSGGEICPMPDDDSKYSNRFHNYSFCACIL